MVYHGLSWFIMVYHGLSNFSFKSLKSTGKALVCPPKLPDASQRDNAEPKAIILNVYPSTASNWDLKETTLILGVPHTQICNSNSV